MRVSPAECAAVGALIEPTHWLARLRVFVELTKPRLTALAVMSTLVGYYLSADGAVRLDVLVATILGAWLVGGGANALNQVQERELDGLMRRTSDRPLPSGRLAPEEAACFGTVMAAVGVGFLSVRANLLTGLIALAIIASYLFLYTPLKPRSPWSTVAGTIPGALPILMGWAASGRELTSAAWVLFAIVALWQLPHFFAIGWMHRYDYLAAGFPIWPARDRAGHRIATASALLCVCLVPLSLLPARGGLAGNVYATGALVLGICWIAVAAVWAARPTIATARGMFRASIIYLPTLMLLLVVDKP